jgi:hypothetical protein
MERELAMAVKVRIIKKSMAEYACGKCGDTIPKGAEYRYFKPGFRGRVKVRRCMKPECAPKMSELDTSKFATVWDAIETAQVDIEAATTLSEIESALSECADSSEEVAQEYTDAQDAAPMTTDLLQERIDMLEGYANDLRAWTPDDDLEEPGEDASDEVLTEYGEALERAKDSAQEALAGFEG